MHANDAKKQKQNQHNTHFIPSKLAVLKEPTVRFSWPKREIMIGEGASDVSSLYYVAVWLGRRMRLSFFCKLGMLLQALLIILGRIAMSCYPM